MRMGNYERQILQQHQFRELSEEILGVLVAEEHQRQDQVMQLQIFLHPVHLQKF